MKKTIRFCLLAIIFLFLWGTADVSATIRYVREGGSGNKSGDSWLNASADISYMLYLSQPGDQLWIAKGTYITSSGGFSMKEGVAIYGGFPTTGSPTMAQRDWLNNETILSGNNVNPIIYNNNNSSSSITRSAILDGFILANGNFSRGGAIYNRNSSPTLKNLRVINNRAQWGGGIFNTENSSPAIINAIIHRNIVQYYGGAICNSGGTVELTNVVISANRTGDTRATGIANKTGGAIYNDNGVILTLTNVTIAYNESEDGTEKGTIQIVDNSTVSIRNTIIYGNNVGLYAQAGSTVSISHSLVQGLSSTDNGNLSGNTDPMFAAPYTGCVRLLAGSPAIDKGNNSYYNNGENPNLSAVQTDVVNNPRFYNSATVDMGAYEFQESEVSTCDEYKEFGMRPDANGIIYVKQTASGTGDGSSWANATSSLQNAINTTTVRQVWVAAGLYEPSASLGMKNKVTIYGGFPNIGEPDISQRNWVQNETILSGKNERQIIYNDPTIMIQQINRTAVLDGFILANGNAQRGGGIRNEQSSPTLSNLRIINNKATWGGGILNNNNSSPAIINSIIYKNVSQYYGGGIYNSGGEIAITNVVIAANKSSDNYRGGAIYNDNGTNVTLTNATIYGNESSTIAHSGAVHSIENSALAIRNSIIYGNSPGLYTEAGSTIDIAYSLVQGFNSTDNGNISGNIDPMFAAADAGCFRLMVGSPAINTGNNTYFNNGQPPDLSDIQTDVADSLRIFDLTIDIGAYEYQGEDVAQCTEMPLMGMRPDENGVIYVKTVATGEADGSSWDNATYNLQQAINTFGVKQVWVAEGIYYAHSSGSSGGFQMKNNVALYGGFPATGNPDMAQREWKANETILSGNHTGGIIYNHSITGAEIDGFTLRDGKGTSLDNNRGGAIYNSYTSLKLRNLLITNNIASVGGAIYSNESSVEISGVTIIGNEATGGWGGGIYHLGASLKLLRTTVANNKSGRYGGGLNLVNSEVLIEQSDIKNNETVLEVSGNGGGIENSNSKLTVKSTLIRNNKTDIGGGIASSGPQAETTLINTTVSGNMTDGSGSAFSNGNGANIKVFNSIIYGNTGSTTIYNSHNTSSPGFAEFKNSIIQDAYPVSVWQSYYGTDGGNNKEEDPLFTDAENGDYTLKNGSPAINTGSNTLYAEAGGDLENDKDLADNKRIAGIDIDMGAYEAPNLPPVISNVNISGDLNAWKTLTATFNYTDPENDTMDTAKSVIQWYISSDGVSSSPIHTGVTYVLQDFLVGFYVAVEVTPNDGSQFGNTVMSEWIGPILPAESAIRYVKQGGSGDMSGTSWENASPDLQAMIDASSPGGIDEIWVAGGTYIPVRRADNLTVESPGNRNNAFVINKDVKIFGGFPSTGNPEKTDCNPRIHKTILSGDLDNNDASDGSIVGNNAYHVVITIPGQSDFTAGTLDGFVIKGGLANSSEAITVENSEISGNYGGGVYYASFSAMILSTTSVIQNKADNGAGIYLQQYSSPQLVSLVISGNEANNQGGGMFFEGAYPQVINSLISGNVAATGGGIADIDGYVNYLNNTISGNKAIVGGGIHNSTGSGYMMYNSIIWGNSTNIENGMPYDTANNIVQGGLAGGTNLDTNPIYLNALSYEIAPFVGGDYRLRVGSPAIDAGSNLYYSGLDENTVDIAGNPRVYNYVSGGIIDIGAYEGAYLATPVYTGYTNIIKTYGDTDFTLEVTSTSSGAIGYISSDPDIATITGNEVSIKKAGIVTITLNQTQEGVYEAGSVSFTLTINKAEQHISFASLEPKILSSPDFILTATTDSGLPLSYTSSNKEVAEVYQDLGSNQWMVTIKGAGTTHITALQPGDENYLAALSVEQELQVVDSTLPVILTGFTAKIEDNGVRLEWSTAKEDNNHKFIIYRKGEDGQFVVIGEKLGAGNSSAIANYIYYDPSPLKGNNYYKLVQIDYDGKVKDLGTRMLAFDIDDVYIKLYPNPTVGDVNLSFEAGRYHKVTVSDINGKVFIERNITDTENILNFDLTGFAQGTYMVTLAGDKERITKKVVKYW